MSEIPILYIGFIEMAIALLLGVYLLWLMIGQLRPKTLLQPLKRLLIASVLLLMLSSVPLMVTYANTLWFHKHALTVINVTIISNATALIITKLVLIAIYRYRSDV